MRKIRIAHIITHLELGGAQKNTLELLGCLNKEKYEACLLSSPGDILQKDAESMVGVKTVFIPELKKKINPVGDIKSYFKISRILKKEKIDIVHTHSSKAGIVGRWAAKKAGIKNIFHTAHGWSFYIEAGRTVKGFYVFLERVTALITKNIFIVSEKDFDEGVKRVTKKEKLKKISYGIKKQPFLEANKEGKELARKALGIRGNGLVVGTIACFKKQKAPIDFIETAKKVLQKNGDIEFVAVGDGPLRKCIEEKVNQLGLSGKIKFLGWRKDIPRVFRAIDLFVLTSHWEGLPIVFIEAMASGVPIVATDVGGARDIIRNDINGYLAEKGDVDTLAEKISMLAENPKKVKELAQKAKESFSEEFCLTAMCKKIDNAYIEAIQGVPL